MEGIRQNNEYEKGFLEFNNRHPEYSLGKEFSAKYEDRISELKKTIVNKNETTPQPSVIILGGGPAGLMRAIQAVHNGCSTHIIEKRGESKKGRDNMVVLTKTTLAMLKYIGVYQLLIEGRLIFPPDIKDKTPVRLGDLEWAMKKVLKDLEEPYQMHFDSTVEKVDHVAKGFLLTVKKKECSIKLTGKIVVNCEGANSSTNELLGVKRISALKKIPVIAAIFKDTRPKIRGLFSLIKYIAITIRDIAVTVFYHLKFVFKLLLFKSIHKDFMAALAFHVPGQAYLGCGLKGKANDTLNQYQSIIEDTTKSDQERKVAKKKLDKFLKPYVYSGVCLSNLLYFLRGFWKQKKPEMRFTAIRSLSSISVVKIGADRANWLTMAGGFEKSSILIAGDAAATVDPVTGLGCNSAIQSSTDFLEYLWDFDKLPIGESNFNYLERMSSRMVYIHEISKQARMRYSPENVVAG